MNVTETVTGKTETGTGTGEETEEAVGKTAVGEVVVAVVAEAVKSPCQLVMVSGNGLVLLVVWLIKFLHCLTGTWPGITILNRYIKSHINELHLC